MWLCYPRLVQLQYNTVLHMCHLPSPCCAAHASAVASSLAAQLAALRHWNDTPVCTLYGAHAAQLAQLQGKGQQQQQHPRQQQQQQGEQQQQQGEQHPHHHQQQQQQPRPAPLPPGVGGQGPVVTFNLLRADGSFVGYRCGGGWSAQLPAMLLVWHACMLGHSAQFCCRSHAAERLPRLYGILPPIHLLAGKPPFLRSLPPTVQGGGAAGQPLRHHAAHRLLLQPGRLRRGPGPLSLRCG